ncbi:hypothetical protein UlMin_039806 [Ulmus minor]
MEAKLLRSLTTKPPSHNTFLLTNHSSTLKYQTLSPLRQRALKTSLITSRSSSNSDQNNTESNSAPVTQQQITPPPESVEVRFRRRSRRQARRQREKEEGKAKAQGTTSAPPIKKWEEMSFTEKAVELYVGEKGALFWLNKFAYASIFIVIGGWILFRFVGPALNLYQLDSAPLPPTSMFKGS